MWGLHSLFASRNLILISPLQVPICRGPNGLKAAKSEVDETAAKAEEKRKSNENVFLFVIVTVFFLSRSDCESCHQ